MYAKIKLSHPDKYVRGKAGLVCGWRVPTKIAYSYSAPASGPYSNTICMKAYSEPQPDLLEKGFAETATEYPSGKAKVRVYVETVNSTDSAGWSTLLGAVWPFAYKAVEVDEDDVEILP